MQRLLCQLAQQSGHGCSHSLRSFLRALGSTYKEEHNTGLVIRASDYAAFTANNHTMM